MILTWWGGCDQDDVSSVVVGCESLAKGSEVGVGDVFHVLYVLVVVVVQ